MVFSEYSGAKITIQNEDLIILREANVMGVVAKQRNDNVKEESLKAFGLSVALMSTSANAMTLDWNGGYRFEWTEVDRPSLGTPTERKAYGLNYLYLSRKIIAADGVNVISRFDVLNNSLYPNSQMGDLWGLNTNTGSPATAGNQGSTNITVSQLYQT